MLQVSTLQQPFPGHFEAKPPFIFGNSRWLEIPNDTSSDPKDRHSPCLELRRFVSNDSHRSSLFGDFSLKTPPLEKASAGWTDEVEQRHPYKEQGDDGDGNEEGDDFVRHGIVSEASQGGGLTMGKLAQPQPNGGRRISSKKNGSESMVRLGEIVLIREQGPGVRRARGTLRQEQYGTGCGCRPCGSGRSIRRCGRGVRRVAHAWACGLGRSCVVCVACRRRGRFSSRSR